MYSEKKTTEVWRIRRQWMEFRSRDSSLESKNSSAIMVFKEYSSKAAIHGVKYIFKDGSLALDRLLWVVAVMVCATGVVFLSIPMCEEYFTSPLLISVESTHYPLYELPFPAVTLCINKVKRRAGEEILARYLNVTLTPEWTNYTWHVMSILSKFGHPYLHLMKEHLQIAAPILHLFKGLNLTQFMLQVFPRCDEVFLRCFWYGHSMNCCQIFNLQRTEGGFCYSFNSLTAENKKHCHPKHFDDSSGSDDFPECRLRHNVQSGTTTGLEVFLKPLNVDDQLESRRSGVKGLIFLHNPLEVPDISQSFHLAQLNYTKLSIKVSPTLIQSDLSVQNLEIRERSCVFPGEVRLKTHPNMYTLRNCLIECRFQFFGKKCGCYPYIYYSTADETVCLLLALQRIRTDLRWLVLRFYWFSCAEHLGQGGRGRDELSFSTTTRTDEAEIM
uniref:Sodium channel protein Nach n=1 Tax=Timema cristinae TaxID=61476 RepID=A0A7R9CZB3_TIMCR|nr:unnamed protein product [Timema cristinae]